MAYLLKIHWNSSISCGSLFQNSRSNSVLAISQRQNEENDGSHNFNGAFCIRNNSVSGDIDITFDKDNITCSGREMKGERYQSYRS